MTATTATVSVSIPDYRAPDVQHLVQGLTIIGESR